MEKNLDSRWKTYLIDIDKVDIDRIMLSDGTMVWYNGTKGAFKY